MILRKCDFYRTLCFLFQDGFAPPEEIDGEHPHPPEEDEY